MRELSPSAISALGAVPAHLASRTRALAPGYLRVQRQPERQSAITPVAQPQLAATLWPYFKRASE